ncbi:MAG TPA: DUF6327 family protein [Flavobacterium sp.]|jgi:hypothetical protein|nr:DUF6327 family protein [Flavobacterium sp.]
MAAKFSSFEQIDTELEILKTEKEIQYQKLIHSLQNTSDTGSSGSFLSTLPRLAVDLVGNFGGVKGIALSFLLKKFIK